MIRYDSDGHLLMEQIRIGDLCDHYPTPFFLYSSNEIVSRIKRLKESLKNTKLNIDLCYAVKALSNLSILRILAENGLGADVVSEGELQRALLAGVSGGNIVFSGVGKTKDAFYQGIENNIRAFHVESLEEIKTLGEITLGLSPKQSVPMALRLNPDIETKTHKKIATGSKASKFGIDYRLLKQALQILHTYPKLKLKGISCHIGSQIYDTESYVKSSTRMLQFFLEIKKVFHSLEYIDLGGGFGVNYFNFKKSKALEFSVETYVQKLDQLFRKHLDIKLILEPGRWLVSSSGILVSKILYEKQHYEKNFLIVDAAMTELIRPSLYQAHHDIVPVKQVKIKNQNSKVKSNKAKSYAVVGPVCESGDIFTEKTDFNKLECDVTKPFVAILNCGAYASSMASQYNSRPLRAEYLVSGKSLECIRDAQSLEDLWKLEKL